MRTSVLSLAFVTAACATPAMAGVAGSSDGDRLMLSLSAVSQQTSRATIIVGGSNGRYDRIAQSDIRAALTLSAQAANDEDGYKIVASRLYLKADGTSDTTGGIDTLAGPSFAASQAASDAYALPLALNGPLAQSAMALCNAIPSNERTGSAAVRRAMAVAIAWRVTTGRFSFKWTNYDRVAPSDEILRNPDFYADQMTQDVETQIDADVTCQPLTGAAIAAKPAVAKTAVAKPAVAKPAVAKPAVAKPAVESPVRHVALTSAPIVQPEARDPAPEQKVSHAGAGKPRCDGGMVRQISTADENFLCLCPGNTTRVETGANAFACERRTRR